MHCITCWAYSIAKISTSLILVETTFLAEIKFPDLLEFQTDGLWVVFKNTVYEPLTKVSNEYHITEV